MVRGDVSRKVTLWSLAALFAALLADLIEYAVDPTSSGDGKDVVAGALEHHGRLVLAGIMVLASAAFLAPGIVGLARRLEQRGRRLGLAAMVLALLGTLGHAALGGIYLVWASLPEAGNNAELIAALDRASDAGAVAILAPLLIAFPVSLVVFFGAMVRGRLAPRWVLAPTLAAPVVAIAGGSGTTATMVALTLFLIAACGLAARLLGVRRVEQAAPSTPPATAYDA